MRYQPTTPAFIGGYFPLLILAFLLGILVYFSLPAEPRLGQILPLSIGMGLLGLVCLVLGRGWSWPVGWGLLFVAFIGFGAGYSVYRTSLITPAFWPSQLTDKRVWVNGTVEEINLRSNGFATVHLKEVKTYSDPEGVTNWPKMVIITHNSRAAEASPGGEVAAQARLKPPQAPLHPGQPDWRQKSFFEGVSATGLVMGDFYPSPPEQTDIHASLRTLRENIAQRYIADNPKATGGVGAALLTGIRSGIPPQTREDFTRSGLAHLMAISGMHLGMVAGFVYVLMRLILVRVGALPLVMDIRKPAALLAFLAAVGYALLAGATIPTIRALSLIGAALLAILFDRLHLGVRILAFIAFALAVYAPYWVAGPSFQLSFVASFALLLWAYRQRETRINLGSLAPRSSKVFSVLQASIVATLATAPVVAVHFGQVPVLGVFANVLAVPFLGLAVLPLGFLSLLPLGFGNMIEPLYLKAIETLNSLAAFVANQPSSTLDIPPEAYPFIFIAAWGLLLAYIFRSARLLVIGLLAFAPLYAALISQPTPVLLAHNKGDIIATPDGYEVYSTDSRQTRNLEHLAEELDENFTFTQVRCDTHFCGYKAEEDVILTYAKPWADIAVEDCRKAEWVYSRSLTPCPGKNIWLTINKQLEDSNVLYEISLKESGLNIKPHKRPEGRPWHK